jgi:hypothetical protein
MREMPVERGVTQSRWDYVNVRGFGALDGRAGTAAPGRLWPLGAVGDKPARRAGGCGASDSERNNRLLTATAFPLLREARRGTTASL